MINLKYIFFWQFVEGILSAFILFTAIWTVFTNVCIFNYKSFAFLLNLLPLILTLSTISWFLLWKFNKLNRKQEAKAVGLTGGKELISDSSSHVQIAWAWLILGAIIIAVYALSQQYILFWGLALAYLIFAYLKNNRFIAFRVTSTAINSKLHNTATVGLCLIAALITMVAHRSDADDAFFLSIPTALLDAPNIPMLQQDTMHGFADVPLVLPVYKLHSLEVFWAITAKLTGLSPIFIAHVVLPPVFAVLFVLAQACLLRLLIPKYWLRALVTVLILLVLLGDVHRSYGNFSLVRLYQGKGILVTVMVPLIFRYAWNFGSQGKLTDWVLLCASQIAALGITSSGLFVAPFAVTLALGGTWQATLKSTKRVVLGLLSSFYLIAVGLLLRQSMMSQVSLNNTTTTEKVVSTISEGSIVVDALHQVLGNQFIFYLLLLAFLSAWTVSTSPKVRIYLLVIPLGFFLVLINPWRVGFITNYVTSSETYWRIFWAVPIPTLFAILFVGLLQPIIKLIMPKLQQQGFLIGLSLTIVMLLPINTLRPENGTIIKFPTIKVPSVEYAIAQKVNRINPPQTAILAPEAISTWIPLISNHAPLISVRNMYLYLLKDYFGYIQVERRVDAVRYISGTQISQRIKARFLNFINKWCIGTVVSVPNLQWEEELEIVLKNHNFKQYTEIDGYKIWVRDSLKCQKGME
ncbi:DUF6077 domain-containing protein [Calothrix sp. CCY 0018]|uniref:DUF6077 domain-containing protein n=1 Tax=Calothrix sp. CCY 0018 TaxID=3103864 RepID=UPI0039C76309